MALDDLARQKVDSAHEKIIGFADRQLMSDLLESVFNTARDEWKRYAKPGGAEKQHAKNKRNKTAQRKKLVSSTARVAACSHAEELRSRRSVHVSSVLFFLMLLEVGPPAACICHAGTVQA